MNRIEKTMGRLRALPASEKRKLLRGLRDSYLELGAEKGLKGFTYDGEPIEGFLPRQYEYMKISDVTGARIRHFLCVDGLTFHPSELWPKMSNSEIASAAREAEERERKAEGYISELKRRGWIDAVRDCVYTARALGFEITPWEYTGWAVLPEWRFINRENGANRLLSQYCHGIYPEVIRFDHSRDWQIIDHAPISRLFPAQDRYLYRLENIKTGTVSGKKDFFRPEEVKELNKRMAEIEAPYRYYPYSEYSEKNKK